MNSDIQPIIEKLDVLIKLIANGLMINKNQREQIELLYKSGFGPKEIAELIGTTPNTVSVSLAAIRKTNKTKLKK